eukprot:TCALIF_10618-PA protein Name:"Protein of unknown function" AED:0.44 eAED:0.44 QI:0/0/0/0.33/1/0.66/3/0/122
MRIMSHKPNILTEASFDSMRISIRALSWGKVAFCDNFTRSSTGKFTRSHATGPFTDRITHAKDATTLQAKILNPPWVWSTDFGEKMAQKVEQNHLKYLDKEALFGDEALDKDDDCDQIPCWK